MLCLHGKPSGTSTTNNGTFIHCNQPEKCYFMCSEDHVPLYDKAIKGFLKTNQTRPKCCVTEKPHGCKAENPESDAERNHAKLKVITDKENENYGRPFFVCSKENNQCSYFEWGDQCLVKRLVCKHGEPCKIHRTYFSCPKPKNEVCDFFMWSDEFQLSDEFQQSALPLWLKDDRYMHPMEKLMLDMLDNKNLIDKALMK